jgi:acyl-CoA reductase-like NAD-dependent aldehyde dehydrogenase
MFHSSDGKTSPLVKIDNLLQSITKTAHEHKTLDLFAPFSGKKFVSIPLCTPEDIQLAEDNARKAQQKWKDTSHSTRKKIILRYQSLLYTHRHELVDILQLEGGKDKNVAFEEIVTSMNISSHYAYRFHNYIKPKRRKGFTPFTQITEYTEPLGVVGIIAPWNYPYILSISEAIPALLSGNAVIIKPAEQTSLSALFGKVLLESAGLPKDLLQVVTGLGSEVGSELIKHVNFIGFTGGLAVAKSVARDCANRMIRCSLELGGKNPMLVFPDVNIKSTVEGAVRGCFTNAGQLCMSFERMYIHESIYDTFVSEFVKRTKEITMGKGETHDVEMGSLISENHLKKVLDLVKDAEQKGAKVLTGAKVRADLGPLFFEPTILENVPKDATLYHEETFGPVVSLFKFKTDEEAIQLANDSQYGLNSSVWSRDVSKAIKIAEQIETGCVNINEPFAATAASVDAPWGGLKMSGMSRRYGAEGIMKYTESKSIGVQRFFPLYPSMGIQPKTFYEGAAFVYRMFRWFPGIR